MNSPERVDGHGAASARRGQGYSGLDEDAQLKSTPEGEKVTLQSSLASPEHEAFVRELASRKKV
ncbi:MAG: hypothetical protein HY040_20970 [Planctomycetes bacterium]|nr:hypothetical protein [Planctomycetota bacterium]